MGRLLSGGGLSRLLSGLIEAAWLGMLVATALYFNPYSRTSYEPDKAAIGRALLLLMAVAWAALRASGAQAQPQAQAQPRPQGQARAGGAAVFGASVFIAWTASVLLSTATSIAPDLSWAGSYARGQGAWLEIGYVGLFAALALRLRSSAQWRRLRLTIAACSVPVCLLALAQWFGIPIPLGNEPLEVNATFGNPNFLAAFLLLPLFVTADFLVEAVAGVGAARPRRVALPSVVVGLQVSALLCARGSAALVGLLCGVALLTAGAVALRRKKAPETLSIAGRWRRRPSMIAAVAAVAVIAWLAAGASRTADDSQVVQLASMFNPERDTNRVRLLIWGAVPQAMSSSNGAPEESRDPKQRWLLGSGPGTTWLALEHSYPAGLAHVESWQSIPDRAHNRVLEILLTRGLLGVACYLLTAAALLCAGLRAAGLLDEPGSTRRFAAMLLTGAALGATAGFAVSGNWPLAAVGLIPGMVVGAVSYLLLRLESSAGKQAHARGRQQCLALLLTAAVTAHLVETQFGIAVTASEAYFWLIAGALVALRYGGWTGLATPDESAGGMTSDGAPIVTSAGAGVAIDGLLVGSMLLTLAFGLMTRGTTAPVTGALVILATWLAGGALSMLGRPTTASRRDHATRFVAASGAIAISYVAFHNLQAATAEALRQRGDTFAAASTIATFFDGYQAWMLAAVVAIAVLLVLSQHGGDEPIADRRSVPRTVLAVALILGLGFALPRAPHVARVRADILAAQAEAARRARRFSSATQLYQEALALRPDEIVYRTGLAATQTDWAAETSRAPRDKRFRRAAQQLRRALQGEQASATEHVNLARLYTLWGETEVDPVARSSRLGRADRHYRDALEVRPQSARYYAEWGRLSVLQGRLDAARWRFGRSLALDPTQGQTYLWVRPLLGADLLDAPNAVAELGPDVGTISPAQIHAALVEHFIEAEQFEAAIESAFRLAAAIPDQPLGYWTIAGLYSRTGRHAEGLPHARRAHQLAQGYQRRQIARLIDNLEATTRDLETALERPDS